MVNAESDQMKQFRGTNGKVVLLTHVLVCKHTAIEENDISTITALILKVRCVILPSKLQNCQKNTPSRK